MYIHNYIKIVLIIFIIILFKKNKDRFSQPPNCLVDFNSDCQDGSPAQKKYGCIHFFNLKKQGNHQECKNKGFDYCKCFDKVANCVCAYYDKKKPVSKASKYDYNYIIKTNKKNNAINEGESAEVTITRKKIDKNLQDIETTVYIKSKNITAESNKDYDKIYETVTFGAKEENKTITITIKKDQFRDVCEYFSLELYKNEYMDKLNIDGEIYNKLPDQQIKIFIINNSKDEKNSSIKKTKPIKSEYFHDNIIYNIEKCDKDYIQFPGKKNTCILKNIYQDKIECEKDDLKKYNINTQECICKNTDNSKNMVMFNNKCENFKEKYCTKQNYNYDIKSNSCICNDGFIKKRKNGEESCEKRKIINYDSNAVVSWKLNIKKCKKGFYPFDKGVCKKYWECYKKPNFLWIGGAGAGGVGAGGVGAGGVGAGGLGAGGVGAGGVGGAANICKQNEELIFNYKEKKKVCLSKDIVKKIKSCRKKNDSIYMWIDNENNCICPVKYEAKYDNKHLCENTLDDITDKCQKYKQNSYYNEDTEKCDCIKYSHYEIKENILGNNRCLNIPENMKRCLNKNKSSKYVNSILNLKDGKCVCPENSEPEKSDSSKEEHLKCKCKKGYTILYGKCVKKKEAIKKCKNYKRKDIMLGKDAVYDENEGICKCPKDYSEQKSVDECGNETVFCVPNGINELICKMKKLGTKYNTETKECECDWDKFTLVNGKCITKKEANNLCDKFIEGSKFKNDKCICEEGYVRSGDGKCITLKQSEELINNLRENEPCPWCKSELHKYNIKFYPDKLPKFDKNEANFKYDKMYYDKDCDWIAKKYGHDSDWIAEKYGHDIRMSKPLNMEQKKELKRRQAELAELKRKEIQERHEELNQMEAMMKRDREAIYRNREKLEAKMNRN